jgi:transposase-like protein
MTGPRTISDDYKAQAVAQVVGGASVASVAKAYGVARSTLAQWVADADDTGDWVPVGGVMYPTKKERW